jgi:hypothetical protein
MKRAIVASMVGICATALAAPVARAQGLEPPPPMNPGAPAGAPPGYPPGYPGAPGAPGGPGAPGAPGEAPNTPPQDDENEDSGLGLEWVWLNADAGFAYADLASFSQSSLGMQKTASSGPTFGVGAGARLLFFTVGLRARDLMLSNVGDLWELGGEAAFHLRVWHIDPYFGVRGGYNFVGQLNSNSAQVATGDTQQVAVHGFNVGPMVGIDFYLAHWISIGADVDAQFLFIQRPAIAVPAALASKLSSLPANEQALYRQSGSSAGFQFAPTAHLGIHF